MSSTEHIALSLGNMSSLKDKRGVVEHHQSRSEWKEKRKETRGAETRYDGVAEEADCVEHDHKSLPVGEDAGRDGGNKAC